MEIESGRLITITDKRGGWLHQDRNEFRPNSALALPKGSVFIVLQDYGTVRLPLSDGKQEVRRLEVLTSIGHGWVYVGNASKLLK
jgi:hypothetical protein